MGILCTTRLPCLLLCLQLAACESLGYYYQAASGQLALLTERQPITRLTDDPATSPVLKAQLGLVLQLRKFAERELLLPVGQQYSHYVDLERDYVVWNVFVAPELSLQAETWCYPIAGCADYRGYFSLNSARAYGTKMAARGFDSYVGGVSAYSTLGWLNDPVLNTFVFRKELKLAELIFHELAHQLLYLPGDSMFNESFATTVAREGVRRWVLRQDNAAHYSSYQSSRQQHEDFIRLVGDYRELLASVYESTSGDDVKRRGKAQLINQLRLDYDSLQREWGGSLPYAGWIAAPINNAKLNSVAIYHNLVPGLEHLLAEENYQLSNFYARCRLLGQLTPAQRHGQLENNSLVVGKSLGIPNPQDHNQQFPVH